MIVRSSLRQTVRTFTSTAPALSNIGKVPIPIPPSITLAPSSTAVQITGPLGTTSIPLEPYMTLRNIEPNSVVLSVANHAQKDQRSMWGTTRTLIHNAIIGMTEGFSVPLYLVGVGYRGVLEEDPLSRSPGVSSMRLNMKLGYSHPVLLPIPPHIKAQMPTATKIILTCTSKQDLGIFAARVRRLRPPEPYKGKGIFVGMEQIRIKAARKK